MFNFRNLRIGTKLFILIFLGVLGFALFALFAFNTITTVEVTSPLYQELKQDQELIADILPPPTLIMEAYLTSAQIVDAVEDNESHRVEPLIEKMATLEQAYKDRHEYWINNFGEEEEESEISDLFLVDSHELVTEFFIIVNEEFIPAAQAGNEEEAHHVYHDELTPLYEAHRSVIGEIVKLQQAEVEEDEEIADAFVVRSENLMVTLALATAILSIALGVVIARSITTPITQLTTVATEISQGNLETQAEIKSTEEIGTLASTFNQMTKQLREILAGLEKRVADRTKDLATVAEIGTATSSILETSTLLNQVVELTKERFNLYHAHIYLLDSEGKNLVLSAGAGEAGRQMLAKGFSIPLDREQSLVARAARERKGVTINDVAQTPDFLPNPLLPNTHAELAVPLIAGNNVLGVFDIQSDQIGRFTESDVNIQTTLASQIAVALQNAHQVEQTIKSASELAGFRGAVNEAAIVSSTNVKGEIDFVNDNFVKISGYSREELIGKDHRIVNSSYLSKEEIRNLWVTIANGGIWHGEFRNKAKNGSYYWVDTYISPILNERGKPVKYLGIRFDITARKEAEQVIARRATELATVAEVGTAASTVLEVNQLLQNVVNLSKERFNLYHAHIYLLDEEGKNLVLTSGAGEAGHQMLTKGFSIPLDREQSLVARAARERKGVTVNDVTEAPDFLPNPLLPNTRSELAVPLIVGNSVLGVFDVQSDQVGRFTEADINIQTTLASQIAIALQNAQAFTRAKKQAERETTLNLISQKIQSATNVESVLQIAARELGHALGAPLTIAQLGIKEKNSRNHSE